MTANLPPFLQELLDRGVDPLDDPTAREWLLTHPEALPAFAALRATLDELGRAPTGPLLTTDTDRVLGSRDPTRPFRMPNGPVVAAVVGVAAALVIALPLVFSWPGAAVNTPDATPKAAMPPIAPSPLPRPDLPTTGRIVDCRGASATFAGAASARHTVIQRSLAGIATHHATRQYQSPTDVTSDSAISIRGVTTTIANVLP